MVFLSMLDGFATGSYVSMRSIKPKQRESNRDGKNNIGLYRTVIWLVCDIHVCVHVWFDLL